MARPDFDLLDLPPDPPSDGQAPILILYDCEFTDFSPNAELLSIGLVAADTDAELYIELFDSLRTTSSDFVRETVLPLFGRHNPEVLTRAEAAVGILDWLEGVREDAGRRQVVVVADSPWDWQFFEELFPRLPPDLTGRLVWHLIEPVPLQNFYVVMERHYVEHGERHHALVDARALKAGLLAARLLERILHRATEVFGDEDSAAKWIKQEVHSLGGVTPLSLLATDAGADLVMDTLGRIEHGVFG